MNLKVFSNLLGGALIAAGVYSCASCSNSSYSDKAKQKASEYLNGYDLLKAERFANQQNNYDHYNGDAIEYWDSLLIEAKSKEAYVKGQQYINDSVNGRFYRKEKFKPKLDTILSDPDVIKCSREEYARYTNAQDFIKARNNAPKNTHFGKNHLVSTTHFWNLITIVGKQQEAFNKGIIDQREKIKQQKNEGAFNALNSK